jgi:putative flippase GtrA
MSHLVTERGTPAGPPPPVHDHGGRGRLVEVVIPVYNEERVLAASVRRLHAYLTDTFPYPFRITIADNASTDGTWRAAQDLAARLDRVNAVHLELKGRGRALRHVWGTSDADVVAYMDVDLSTDLDAFLPLVAPLISGHSDLAIGSRLTRGSAVVRGPRREVISRCYNLLLRTALAARFSDAQCGFKAARTEIVQALLPSVEDEEWFFDTELLLLAERNGLRIHEVPVDWVDDPDSRVDVVRTARDDLRGMARVARRMLTGAFRAPVGGRRARAAGDALPAGMARQLPAFAVIGAISTLAQLILFVLLRLAMGPLWANALSLVVTTVGNTAANRRFTFGVTGTRRALRQQLEGGLTFLLGLALSTGGLALLHAAAPGASRAVEVGALIAANAVATLVRFLLMRAWIFHPRRLGRATAPPAPDTAAPRPAAPRPDAGSPRADGPRTDVTISRDGRTPAAAEETGGTHR